MKTSAVKITKKEFNATLVAERTAQIACCNGKVNRLNDIVAVLNDTEKMQNVKDNAEWRTVTKTRANGVMFSNGSTLDYKANAEYYRVGNVIIVVNVSEIEDFDAAYNRVNVPYYNVMAYPIDAPELETPNNTDTTMKANNTILPAKALADLAHNQHEVINVYSHPFTYWDGETTTEYVFIVRVKDGRLMLLSCTDVVTIPSTVFTPDDRRVYFPADELDKLVKRAKMLTDTTGETPDNNTPSTSDTMNAETKTMNEARRNELQAMADNAREWDIKTRGKAMKSDYAYMVLELMDTEEHDNNYCSALREVLAAFPEVDRDELEIELDRFI